MKGAIRPSTIQKYLGTRRDSEKEVFWMPQERLDKMRRRLREAVNTQRIRFIPFGALRDKT